MSVFNFKAYSATPKAKNGENPGSSNKGRMALAVSMVVLAKLILIQACERPTQPVYDSVYDSQSATFIPLPTIRTADVDQITPFSARSGGAFVNNYGKPVTMRGVCWTEDAVPDLSHTCTTEGPGNTSFVSQITGLKPGRLYVVRAYATNPEGTVFGSVFAFGTLGWSPVFTGSGAHDITFTSAELRSELTDERQATSAGRGFCWADATSFNSDDPEDGRCVAAEGAGVGSFSIIADELDEGEVYRVVPFAEYQGAKAFGASFDFSTQSVRPSVTTNPVSAITASNAQLNGSIAAQGATAVTSRGFCYSDVNETPRLDDTCVTASGSGIGNFSRAISGLQADTRYYVAAWATNGEGTAFAPSVYFDTPDGIPTFGQVSVTSIRSTSATISAEITDNGGAPISSRGVCFNTEPVFTAGSQTCVTSSQSSNTFETVLTGLQPETSYYARAFVTNSVGTHHSIVREFTTTDDQARPGTATAVQLTSTSVTIEVALFDMGSRTVEDRGVCLSQFQNPSLGGYCISDSGSPEASEYTVQFEPLQASTRYYFRQYFQTSEGVIYGSEGNVTTRAPMAPCVNPITDSAGNSYPIVQIGDQCWMAQNLNTRNYRNGNPVPDLATFTDDPVYGLMYTWAATTDSRGLCPTGWRVPSDDDWKIMERYLGLPEADVNTLNAWRGNSISLGGRLKRTGTTYWNSPNTGATNETGFSAVAAGYRQTGSNINSFSNRGLFGFYWTSDPNPNNTNAAIARGFGHQSASMLRQSADKREAYTVRCVRE